MKVGIITTAGDKGQIVIPKSIRNDLGIDNNTPLHISLVGEGIYIYPISAIVPKINKENLYVDILKKTLGSWGLTKKSKAVSKKRLELKASKARKQLW